MNPSSARFCLGPLGALLLSLPGMAAPAAGDPDEFTRAVAGYELPGRDFVLVPVVVMQAQIAVMGEAQGRTFPADRINPKNPALVRAHEKRVGEIMAQLNADRARLGGR